MTIKPKSFFLILLIVLISSCRGIYNPKNEIAEIAESEIVNEILLKKRMTSVTVTIISTYSTKTDFMEFAVGFDIDDSFSPRQTLEISKEAKSLFYDRIKNQLRKENSNKKKPTNEINVQFRKR